MDTQRIGLLETLWNVVDALIYTCLRASVQFHDVLQGFRSRRGMGTAIMELNLAQEITRIDHDPFFLVILDLRKAYNTVYRDSFIHTLEL